MLKYRRNEFRLGGERIFMKIKNNVNYFTKNDTLKFIGVAMVVLGFVLYYVGWGMLSWILICACIPVGAVLFIVGSSGRASDDDIEEFINVKSRELDPNLDLDKDYSKRIMKHTETLELEGYEYREDLMFAKTKKGSVRTSEFVRSVIYILNDALHFTVRRISLISDEETADVKREIFFDDIERLEISEEQKRFVFRKKTFSVKDKRLVVVMKNGESMSIPVHDDLRSEQIVENINHIIDNYRKAK